MHAAPIPADEAERVALLRDLRLAELAPQLHLRRILRVAQTLTGTPHAIVALIDGDDVIAVERMGEGPRTVRRADAMCAWSLGVEGVLWLEDAATDRRFCAMPFVATAPYIRFYAAAPIIVRGRKVGAVAVADTEVRAFDQELADRLEDVAAILSSEFELKVAKAQLSADEVRVRAEKALLDVLIEDAPLSLAMFDREMRYIRASRKWRTDRDIPDDVSLVGRCHYEVTPQVAARWREVHARCLAGATEKGDRDPYWTFEGRERISRWEVTPWYGSDGEVGGILVMTEDLTEQVAVLDQIAQSETRLRLAAEIADLTVWEYSFANRAFQYAQGATPASLAGDLSYDRLISEWLSRVHEDDRARVGALWAQQMESGVAFNAQYRQHDRLGRVVWHQNVADMIRDEHGRPDRIVGVVRDITEHKLGELALENARAEAEAANSAKSDFLANMSHEIRTPLNGVLGVASALARTNLDDSQRQMVQIIEHSGQVLEVLLSDVLDLARIESGKLELRPELFDLSGALRETASLFAAGARAKGLELRVDLDPALTGGFQADPVRLRQIVSNLLSNAVKFTGAGSVSLTARISAEAEGAAAMRITVADTGIGFDEATRQRLFERFEQADGSITRRFGGTGLGLAICRSLATMMGGRLWAESTPGQGSSFILELELKRGELAAAAPHQGVETAAMAAAMDADGTPEAPRPMRVLLAEDHPTNRRVVQLMLEGSGVELTMVENGALAVEMFGLTEFDLILMDMQMPVMDGLNATRSIRATERAEQRRPTPIYALTANAMPEHVEQTKLAGADGHLPKPISAESLMGVIQAVCAGEPAVACEDIVAA